MTLYKDQPQGHPPVPPAQLALATLLQAYTQVSDDEVIEATTMDRRWQLVLDCLDCETPPFSKGTLVVFRQRLIAQQMDRRLLERTVEVAATSGAFGARQLRAALDSSPLWGAGRVEDTYNLLGHALRKAVGVNTRQQGHGLAAVADVVGATLISGLEPESSSGHGLGRADSAAAGPDHRPGRAQCRGPLARDPARSGGRGPGGCRQHGGGAPGTRTRHHPDPDWGAHACGRGWPKIGASVSKTARCATGARAGVCSWMATNVMCCAIWTRRLIVAVGITPANAPEAHVTEAIETDLAAQQCTLRELHIDRAYLASKLVQQRADTLAIFCKAWPVRQGPYFAKSAFHIDWAQHELRCPGGEVMPFAPGEVVHFPAATCGACALRERCTTSASGRSVSIHPDEALLQELRERQQTPQGRAQLRERVAVEHALAHVGHWQGRRARYRGVRKNVFDLRRCAVVHNLHVLMRLPQTARQAA